MLSFLALWLSFTAYTFAGSCHFTLDLTWKAGSPDGFEREIIFINEQFPGPLIEIKQDDWVEITVVNSMPFNTTLHAHGIEQLNTPWADGVPGLSQREIQPGDSYTYKWHANQYGSYMYHAHSRGQIDDGCYGPIIVKPKAGIAKPFDKISPAEVKLLEAAELRSTPILLSDWRHATSQSSIDLQYASGIESALCMDSILVNGKGAVNCWPREELTQFTSASLAPLLAQANLTLTDKGCVPAKLLEIIEGADADLDAIPPEVFDICTPTKGSREIITAPKWTKWLALDIISTAGIQNFAFSIDEHPLWVYAVDGHYIEPLKVDALTIFNGERYSIFVELSRPVGSYGIRVAGTAAPQLINTIAVLAYEAFASISADGTANIVTSNPSINAAGLGISSNVTFFDPTQMVSFPPQFPQPAPEVAQTFILTLQTVGKPYDWAVNGTLFPHSTIDNLDPPLLYRNPSNLTGANNLIITTKNNTWVDLIFKVNTIGQPSHPMHKHSNKGFIIGQGEGEFIWKSVAEAATVIPENFNFVTPPFRDGFVTLPSATKPTWLAVRYQVVNPGPFLIHCHIQSHLEGGMAMVILDGVDAWPEAPACAKN